MTQNTRTLITVGGALVLGLLFGAALSSRNDDVEASFTRRVAGLEQQIATGLGALDTRLAALETTAAEIAARTGETAAHLGTLTPRLDGLDAATGQVGAALGTLGDRVAALGERLAGLSAATPPTLAAPAADAGPMVLGVGETGVVGAVRLFVSRIDPDAREVRLRIVGRGDAAIGVAQGALALGNGCAVTLTGIEGGQAHIAAACGE